MRFRRFMAPALAALALCYGASLVTADDYDEGQIMIPRDALKGATAYDAAPFFKGSLRQGTVFQLPQSNTFVLVLFSS